MQVYKIFDPQTKYYLLVVSKIKDSEMVLEHEEHYYALNETEPIGKFFFTLRDDVEIEVSPMTPKQFIEMNDKSGASNEFEQHIVVPKPRGRGKKDPAEPKQPKPKATPKPKGKKSAPINIQDNGRVDFNQ